jgi:hypothetical protein
MTGSEFETGVRDKFICKQIQKTCSTIGRPTYNHNTDGATLNFRMPLTDHALDAKLKCAEDGGVPAVTSNRKSSDMI